MTPLFDAIVRLVPPAQDRSSEPFGMQIANLGYDNYLGRLGVGRVYKWTTKVWDHVSIISNDSNKETVKLVKYFLTIGLNRVEANIAKCGDIVTIAGIPDIFVWETVWVWDPMPLPTIQIDEPTLSMEFLVNDSPFAGKDGKYMTSRNLQERLEKEQQTNVWLNVDIIDGKFIVSWRWELHLWVLIESIRREGRELQVETHKLFSDIEIVKKQSQ